ncbi:thiamine-monophosphate kinase [Zhongshania antarctica]|uniref:Thiamine-monophosphate kinase n=1 Tax=Zhongshania antarctica TaxID=641702 RepID=A0A840R1I3_9GAMM|nr:thiamine-phosphate kinase [Zhongshania antarctica]MBB5186498.1 thiamine-monophosphate kinase [Zhongshania antarctica]
MPVSEFQLIQQYFKAGAAAAQACPNSPVRCGIGDDCAVLALPAGDELLVSVDTLVESVHFPANYPSDLLARRALAVCVSDLAACGATPLGFTLALTLPKVDEPWLAGFADALAVAAAEFGIVLVGGDTTRGPLCLSLQVMGSAPAGTAILRSGARPGDLVFVSGQLGDARAALAYLDKPLAQLSAAETALLARYHSPEPRLALGQQLRGLASAAVDISDGLAADLGHILNASGVAAVLYTEHLALSAALTETNSERAIEFALSGGDDYELCFTVPAEHREAVVALSAELNLRLTEVGYIDIGEGLACYAADGGVITPAAGYQHF